jgi:hypothetical protein
MGLSQACRVRNFATTTKDWKHTKFGATRGNHHQQIGEIRTAKERHNYVREAFGIDKMYIW